MAWVSWGTRKVIVTQLVDEVSSAFLGDLLHDVAGENLGAEDGGHTRLTDLFYQVGHLTADG